jgi:hypothetical protein
MTTADFHNAQRTFSGVGEVSGTFTQVVNQLHHLFWCAIFVNETHLFFLAVQQRADIRLNVKHVLQRLERVARFSLINDAHGKTNVHQDPLPQTWLTVLITTTDQRQVDVALNTANIDLGLVSLNGADLTRNTYAHRCVSSQESH